MTKTLFAKENIKSQAQQNVTAGVYQRLSGKKNIFLLYWENKARINLLHMCCRNAFRIKS